MSEKVVFSQLSRKFIDENDATPAEAQQVVYYLSLIHISEPTRPY